MNQNHVSTPPNTVRRQRLVERPHVCYSHKGVQKVESSGVRVLFLLLLVALAAWWFCLLTGCATTNLSSAERRAGTYKAGTVLEIDPVNRRIYVDSSGDDEIEIDKATFPSGTSIEGLKLKMNRSDVVKAQGKRALDMTDLLGQDIPANQIWGDTLIGSINAVGSIVGSVAPSYLQYKQAESQYDMARENLRLQMLLATLRPQAATQPVGGP